MGTKDSFVGHIPTPQSSEAGVYLYIQNDLAYVGSTVQSYGRFIQHTSALARGAHVNKQFQAAYDANPNFDVHFASIPPDRQQEDPLQVVREMEQVAIDNLSSRYRLLNEALDVWACGTGKSPTEETREKIRQAMLGRTVSEETRRRQSESLQGHVLSEETKLKISLARKGTTQSEEHRAKSKAAGMVHAKSVVVGDARYESIADVAREFNLCSRSVRKRINSNNPIFQDWKYEEQ